MHASKSLQLVKLLTAPERAAFTKYAQRFNTKKETDALQLFNYFKRFAPAYSSNRLQRKMVCRHLFSTVEVTSNQLNAIAFKLTELLENFLIYYDLEQDESAKEQLLVGSLKRRNHPSFATKSQDLIQQIAAKKLLTTNDHLRLFQLNDDLWSDINTEKITGEIKHFQQANDCLDSFYLLQKLQIILEYNTSQFIRKSNAKLDFEQEVVQMLKTHSTLKTKITVKFWLAAIQMQQSNERTDFLSLKRLFFESFAQLTKHDAQVIFVLLTNFYNAHLWTDADFYAQQGFLLYQFAADHGLLLENGRIREIEFGNAITVGFVANQNKWTFDFIDRFKSNLSPLIRTAICAQAHAFYHFRQSQFEEVISLLVPIEQQEHLSFITDLKIRTLKLRSFFELWLKHHFADEGLYFSMESQVKSFVGFIKKNPNLASSKKQHYLNFTHFFKKLIRLEYATNRKIKATQLQSALDEMDFVSYKNWLTEKIEQMKNTYPTNR